MNENTADNKSTSSINKSRPQLPKSPTGIQGLDEITGGGQGGFSPATTFAVGARSNPNFISIGDFNNDGKVDLIVADVFSEKVSVLLNTTTPNTPPTGNVTILFFYIIHSIKWKSIVFYSHEFSPNAH